jgi:hypothetical protein
MLIQVQTRLEQSERDAIQAIADRQMWTFAQALRIVIRQGLTAVTEWDGDELTSVVVGETEFNRG